MAWLKARIDKIRELMSSEAEDRLTYAALECRLALELVCYERLRVAHSYISHHDIRRWQPSKVINTLIQEVDPGIASSLSLSVSRTPVGQKDLSKDEFEALEYIEVGKQIGFDVKQLAKLWNAISSFLHVDIPKSPNDPLRAYRDESAIRKKVEDVLKFLEPISNATLVTGGFGATVNFECDCGTLNRRRAELLKRGQVVSCLNPECLGSWEVVREDEGFGFKLRTIEVECHACSHKQKVLEREATRLPLNTILKFDCEACQARNLIQWRLMQARPAQ